MSSGAFKVLSEVLPNFKSSISDLQEIRNKYLSNIQNLEQKNEAYSYNTSNLHAIERVNSDLQRKHHSTMKKIESKGRRKDYSYRLSDSDSEEVKEDLNGLVDDIDDEIKSVRIKRAAFIGFIVLAIVAPIIVSVI